MKQKKLEPERSLRCKLRTSMTRKGDCRDTAPTESL